MAHLIHRIDLLVELNSILIGRFMQPSSISEVLTRVASNVKIRGWLSSWLAWPRCPPCADHSLVYTIDLV